jgi:hypothetical protein
MAKMLSRRLITLSNYENDIFYECVIIHATKLPIYILI